MQVQGREDKRILEGQMTYHKVVISFECVKKNCPTNLTVMIYTPINTLRHYYSRKMGLAFRSPLCAMRNDSKTRN